MLRVKQFLTTKNFCLYLDLMFNKRIDGCDQPGNVKCKVKQPSRGGGAPSTTTPFPRTTEFDETLLASNDYNYDYYYYDEAVDDKTTTSRTTEKLPETESVGSGRPTKQREQTSGGRRPPKPYTNIERDRYVLFL